MNALHELDALETKLHEQAVEVIVLVATAHHDFEDLARRCRELLATHNADDDCPPGHWLG